MWSRALPWLLCLPHTGVGGLSLNEYFRVLHDLLTNSVVGGIVFHGVSFLMLSLLVVIVETVLSSLVFVGPVVFAGTVSGASVLVFPVVALCCAAVLVHVLVHGF